MDDVLREAQENSQWLAGMPRLTVAETADLIDALDPAVDPLRQMAILRQLAETNPGRALIYLQSIASRAVAALGPDGARIYRAQLRRHAALGGAS